VDSVSVYDSNPGSLPNGDNWAGFGKSINVTLKITGGPLPSPLVTTFLVRCVALGASWGQAVAFTLPPGTYTITALGVDQGGYRSSASSTITLQ
jgi:hypothetical protein